MPFNQGGMNGGMTGGVFGPPGGSQNFDAVGMSGPPMSDQALQALLGQIGSQSQMGPTFPIYDTPAPAGMPPAPQGVPGIGTTGIDPSMIAQVGAAGGGLQGMDFGPQGEMRGMQQGLMNVGQGIGRRRAEEERLRQLFLASQASGNRQTGA